LKHFLKPNRISSGKIYDLNFPDRRDFFVFRVIETGIIYWELTTMDEGIVKKINRVSNKLFKLAGPNKKRSTVETADL
jgi:hypothetical protein